MSRPPARTRGLKLDALNGINDKLVASSREDAWIETLYIFHNLRECLSRPPARTRGLKPIIGKPAEREQRRVLPRGRVD